MINTLIHANCLDVIARMPDDFIDVCLTDPPYGIEFQSNQRTVGLKFEKIENDESPFIDWILPVYNKMKQGGRLLCFYRWDVQDNFLNEIKRVGFTVKSQLVWDKCSHGMGDLKGEFAPQHESIIYATKGRYEFKGNRPTTVFKVPKVGANNLIHPNEKPVELIRRLLLACSEEGEQVFDPFGGSFSTYIAAVNLKRHCVTCELSDTYYEIGKKRVHSLINNEYF